jgi:hypothetical protein
VGIYFHGNYSVHSNHRKIIWNRLKKSIDRLKEVCYNKAIKEREERTMSELSKKLDILMYMVENGYHLMNRTMDEMCEIFTVDELQDMMNAFLGDD